MDAAQRQGLRHQGGNQALLGQGVSPLTVDNAASCVVASVNTQLRKNAYQRARDVLAWRYVINQIDDDTDGELTEAKDKLAAAEKKLRTDVAKAFQHYAYLIRVGDELVVEFKRFDSDSLTSLRGDQVWTQLVADSRATTSGTLSATYLAALLTTFARALTPREVVQSFYKNPPGFPLVPSTDEIRRAMFSLISDDWELVDAEGSPLALSSPGRSKSTRSARPFVHGSPTPTLTRPKPPLRMKTKITTTKDYSAARCREASLARQGSPLRVSARMQVAAGHGRAGGAKVVQAVHGRDRQPKHHRSRNTRADLATTQGTIEGGRPPRQQRPRSSAAEPHADPDHRRGRPGRLESKANQIGAKVRVEDDDF